MGKEQNLVEIYTVKPDNSDGRMVYPKNGYLSGDHLTADEIWAMLRGPHFRGLYFRGEEGPGFFLASYGVDLEIPFAESILIDGNDPQHTKVFGKISARIAEVLPDQPVKVVIY